MNNTRPNSSFFAAQIQTPLNVQTLTLLLVGRRLGDYRPHGHPVCRSLSASTRDLAISLAISHDPAAAAAH